uniref:Uncharacterized protein n=1 Tax=Oryza meridionalis TaxID=40149 RepID=A0A0E0EX31_9ORYZ
MASLVPVEVTPVDEIGGSEHSIRNAPCPVEVTPLNEVGVGEHGVRDAACPIEVTPVDEVGAREQGGASVAGPEGHNEGGAGGERRWRGGGGGRRSDETPIRGEGGAEDGDGEEGVDQPTRCHHRPPLLSFQPLLTCEAVPNESPLRSSSPVPAPCFPPLQLPATAATGPGEPAAPVHASHSRLPCPASHSSSSRRRWRSVAKAG